MVRDNACLVLHQKNGEEVEISEKSANAPKKKKKLLQHTENLLDCA